MAPMTTNDHSLVSGYPARRASATALPVALKGVVALLMVALLARPSEAQLRSGSVDVFASIGGVAGATPLLIDGARRVGVHAGFRGDAGFQMTQFGLALGMRAWELAPTKTFGGYGLDGFVTGEWRVSFDTRSMVRASLGGGFADIDGGRGPQRNGAGSSGVTYSFGVVREIFAPSGARAVLSLDLVMPNVNTDVDGRRQPVFEIGFGYRHRESIAIGVPPRR